MSMRVAIAGGGGFGYILARELAQTANAILVLSTRHRPEFQHLGIQVAVVDYANIEALRYILQGVDLVISTVRDLSTQLVLIDAARHARVRAFVPSEFEGALAERAPSTPDVPWDQRSEMVRQHLTATNDPMRHTVFSCGIFYERFLPGGLGKLDIGRSVPIKNAGDYLLNIETAIAHVVRDTPQGTPVAMSMTSVYDVARYIAAAVELGVERWPTEWRMRGDHLTVTEIVHACSTAREVPFTLVTHDYSNIQSQLVWALRYHDLSRWYYFQHLRMTAEGRYDFTDANLNEMIEQTAGVEVRPERFLQWAWRVCGEAQLRLQPCAALAMP